MKRKVVAMILSMAMVFTMLPATNLRAEQGISAQSLEKAISPTDGTMDNLARSATASAGYTNTYGISPEKINDGTLATSDSSTSWNCWGAAENQYPMDVTLTWTEAKTVSSMRVMWWADGGGVTFPSSAKVQYLDGEEWKDLSDVGIEHGGTNGTNGVWNNVNFDSPVTTTSLRLMVGRGSGAVGISEWEVFGDTLQEFITGANITGISKIAVGATEKFTGGTLPDKLSEGASYEWSITSGQDNAEIQGAANEREVSVKSLKEGTATLHLKVTKDSVVKETDLELRLQDESIKSIDVYKTSTKAGVAPILPDTVVANGLEFDEPTPSEVSETTGYDFGETFNSKLLPVTWETVAPENYAADKIGKTFTVKGTVSYNGTEHETTAEITVKAPVSAAESNNSVTFENVQLNDIFWTPKQETNAITSLNKAISEIEKDTGGEPNFDNAIKKLNGQPYNSFKGFVFQDSDIYKSIEAISYTLSATQNDTGTEITAQRQKLQEKLNSWIEKIEQVQYADGYIDTFFTLRSESSAGGNHPGTHRWIDLSNHEMYNAGHFLESVVAYTRYREGINDPDYRLYVAGKRFADHIVSLFGPNGTRHEVPGHEEIELALVKFGKLAEQYEGENAGQKYYDTAKLLIDRRGEAANLRDSGYKGDEYSQDKLPFKSETNAVGHAVRANYFYTGVTDIATLLPENDPDRADYINSLNTIWDSVTAKKTYITGGIGATTATSSAEGFGADYDLPPQQSYCEICAAIAAANWNQRMNLLHEDGKYADMVEKNLYNSILVGENLDGNLFYYSTLLRAENGNARSEWFGCACCPPNLMRTIASLSGYMYTAHKNDLFVNMFVGSNGTVNLGGTQVGLKQETNYPWDGAVKMTVTLPESKAFAMKIRIPGWINEQKDKNVVIKVNDETVTATAEKGYATINRTWNNNDVVSIDMPMEIRMTESNENVEATQGMIGLQRGPIVYCIEKAGNVQLNPDIKNFDPMNFVIPRKAELKAEFNDKLLNGVVEITGDVKYATGNGKEMIDAKLQAVPYYAWNNRNDDADYVAGLAEPKNESSKMLIWTMADTPNNVKEPGIRDNATPSVSYVGWNMGADRFADGDKGTFWNGNADPDLQTKDQWMMYDFGTRKAEITESKIMFSDDGGGVMVPTSIKIEYTKDDGTWAEVTPVGEWTYVKNKFNTYQFEKIVTSKIRVTMNHAKLNNQKVAVAVCEWELTGDMTATQEEKQPLADAIARAEKLNSKDYTKESWNALQAAITQAKKVLADDKATFIKDVSAAQTALSDAIDNLVPVTTEVVTPGIKDEGNGKYEVTIPEITPGQENVPIKIPDSLAESIKNSTETKVSVNIKLSENLAEDKVQNITIPKEVLEAVKETGKDLTVSVAGSTSYQWVFTAESLKDAQISDLNLVLGVADSDKDEEIKGLLKEDEKGMVLSFAQEGQIPGAKVTVDASKMGWKAGETVTLGYYNPETKKLEELGTYTVGEDGKVAIDAAKGGKYVLWKKNTVATTIPVESISLNKSTLTLTVGKSETLTAKVAPDNATNQEVTWESSNDKVATVSNGKVTAKAKGTATITVASSENANIKKTCTVTVKAATIPVTKVKLNKTKLTLNLGKSYTLKATISPSNASNKGVTFSSSKKTVATVSSKGVVKAKKVGTTTITVKTKDGGKKATCKITVKRPVTKVKLNKTKLTLGAKETFTLKATVSPSNATNKKVTYKSSNKKVATVSSKGKVKAVKKGKATITATADGKRAKCTITVKAAPKKITLNAKSKTLKKGKTFQLKAKLTKNTASYKITYKTSNKKIATVSSSGKIKAVKKGKATITATTFNKKKATIKITVK